MSENKKADLMHPFTEPSFVLHEMRLFLDTHPECAEGLEYYNRHARLRAEAIDEYTRLYGPIRFYDVTDTNSWQWVAGPWPWEGAC